MALIRISNVAPVFTLNNQDEEKISLKNYRDDKIVVLYFYPRALTPGCTVQSCGLRDVKGDYTRQGAVVLGISPDMPDKLTKFTNKYDLNFDLLSDEGHKVAEKYGTWGSKKFMGKEFMGILRTTFIIGKDGRVKHVFDKVKTKTHHDDVLNWIKENKSDL